MSELLVVMLIKILAISTNSVNSPHHKKQHFNTTHSKHSTTKIEDSRFQKITDMCIGSRISSNHLRVQESNMKINITETVKVDIYSPPPLICIGINADANCNNIKCLGEFLL